MKKGSSCFLGLFLLSLSSGCAQPHKSAAPTRDYVDDARACNRQSQTIVKTRVNLDGISEIGMPVGVDKPQYRICMEALGWKVDPAKDLYLSLVETCRRAAQKPTEPGVSGTVKLGGGFDSALYEECIKNQGVIGKVIVLPIKPETTE